MSRSTRRGLTRIDVLVLIAVVAILLALLVPPRRRVREAAARTQCMNNLKQLMLAMHTFADVRGPAHSVAAVRLFPPGCLGPATNPEERLSWMVALLPYLEQQPLYQQFDLKKGYAGNPNAVQTQVPLFDCPESAEATTVKALTNYVVMSGIGMDAASQPAGAVGNGFMGYDRPTSFATITDGMSNTIALMETRVGLGPWARGGASTLRGFDPADAPWQGDNRPFGGHAGGINAAFADASVRFLQSSIDADKLAAAITIAGGEPVDLN